MFDPSILLDAYELVRIEFLNLYFRGAARPPPAIRRHIMKSRNMWILVFQMALLSLTPRPANSDPMYSLTYIGLTDARGGISDTGFIAGSNGFVDEWHAGTITRLGVGQAYSVNNAGTVVGQTPDGMADEWSNGTLTKLGQGAALGINDLGQVVGYRISGNTASPTLWTGGTASTLTPLGGPSGLAFGINNAGQVVGTSVGTGFATLWQNGTAQNLGTLPGTKQSIAYSINATGQIVGQTLDSQGIFQPFSYQNGLMSDLGTLPGYPSAIAISVNSSGSIVGYSFFGGPITTYRPYIYQNGQMTNLNDLILPNSGWTMEVANGINDLGQIVGFGDYRGHQNAGFLLTPCNGDSCFVDQPDIPQPTPEPATSLLLFFGLLGAVFMPRSKRKPFQAA